MVERVNIPVASVPIIRPDGKPVLLEKPWYQLLQGLAKAHNDLAVDNAIDTDLASEVTGVLPVANGGTGKATLSTYRVLAGGTTATGALQQVGAGTSGNPLLSNGASALPSFGAMTVTDCISGIIQYPEAQDYVVWINIPFAITVLTMTTRCSTGTCTLAAKKNTTAITGLSNSVSTTEDTNTATAGNVFARRLEEAVHELTATPAIATGKLESVGALSGVALQVLYAPLTAKTEKKRGLYGDLLEEIGKRVLDIGNFGYENDVDVTWPETTPQDAKAEAETLAIHKTLGVSTDTILDKLGYDAAAEAGNKQGEMDAEAEMGDRLLSAFERGADSARRGATNGQEAATGQPGQVDAGDGGRLGAA
jgi:hypothetical protein